MQKKTSEPYFLIDKDNDFVVVHVHLLLRFESSFFGFFTLYVTFLFFFEAMTLITLSTTYNFFIKKVTTIIFLQVVNNVHPNVFRAFWGSWWTYCKTNINIDI